MAVAKVSRPPAAVPSAQLATCRICASPSVSKAGEVEFYVGYDWPIYDCASCGCAFTLHDNSAYELLYSEKSSCYSRYTVQSEACKARFDAGDIDGLKAELFKASKYQFILDEIAREPTHARLLEIGSSRGHLTSYFILAGWATTGVDVSQTAVRAAIEAFGPHFLVAGDPAIAAGGPYDAIFHVGTIGCVDDPIGMTEGLLELLRPGGRLLFNAPNREGLALKGQLWVEGAPPPDLVTMFRPGFWRQRFGDRAEVLETVEIGGPAQNVVIGLRNLMGRRWRKPVPIAIGDGEQPPTPTPRPFDAVWALIERVARRVASPAAALDLVPAYPTEYGIFVRMTKR